MYAENFLVARTLYPLITKRAVKTQLNASDRASAQERDYRDLLNEANLNYFHREYTIALQNYLELQAKILEQSHPELPKVGGVGSVLGGVSLGVIDHRRLLEMGRRILIDTNPGDPIEMKGGKARNILPGEFSINAEIAKLGGLGLDTKVAVRDQIEGLRVQARRAAAEDRLESALKFYEGAAKLAETTSDVRLLAGVVTEAPSTSSNSLAIRRRPPPCVPTSRTSKRTCRRRPSRYSGSATLRSNIRVWVAARMMRFRADR
jgi:hypothetical protein